MRAAILAIAYLRSEADRMHRLEHRLHRFGTFLFASTATVCACFGIAEMAEVLHLLHHIPHALKIAATVASAALPAIGAAIYGIRMQGDFAGAAGRSHSLALRLAGVRGMISDDEPGFETLRRQTRRVSDLLTLDVTRWFDAYLARPLALPG